MMAAGVENRQKEFAILESIGMTKKQTRKTLICEGAGYAIISSVSANNLIESFNKTFKSWYKKIKGFKSFESTNSLISNFIFYYNFIKSHSSLSNLTPAEVCGINYSHRDKINWFVKY